MLYLLIIIELNDYIASHIPFLLLKVFPVVNRDILEKVFALQN
jgi:hypothetical protein